MSQTMWIIIASILAVTAGICLWLVLFWDDMIVRIFSAFGLLFSSYFCGMACDRLILPTPGT